MKRRTLVVGLLLSLASQRALAADQVISARRLFISDRGSRGVRLVLVAKADSPIQVSAGELTAAGATISIGMEGTPTNEGVFVIPAGELATNRAGWKEVPNRYEQFINQDSPDGPTSAKAVLLKRGRFVKLIARGLGDSSLLRAGEVVSGPAMAILSLGSARVCAGLRVSVQPTQLDIVRIVGSPEVRDCPRCGDGRINQSLEECDGDEAAACGAAACHSDCSCSECGNGLMEIGEECDGSEASACGNDVCLPDCTCAVCGNGITEPGEECDRDDADSCGAGTCRNDCKCPVCGNGIWEVGEECDAPDDGACQGLCRMDCTCPEPVCGNGVTEDGEECDTGDPWSGDGCDPDCTWSLAVCIQPYTYPCLFAGFCNDGDQACVQGWCGVCGALGEGGCDFCGECNRSDPFNPCS